MAYVKKKREKLTNQQVAVMMMKTLDRFGIKYERVDLLPLFREQIPIPIIHETETHTVWIDREYIAYSSNHEHKVHYIYLTKRHLEEEHSQRHNSIISESFEEAAKRMKYTHRNYALLENVT